MHRPLHTLRVQIAPRLVVQSKQEAIDALSPSAAQLYMARFMRKDIQANKPLFYVGTNYQGGQHKHQRRARDSHPADGPIDVPWDLLRQAFVARRGCGGSQVTHALGADRQDALAVPVVQSSVAGQAFLASNIAQALVLRLAVGVQAT